MKLFDYLGREIKVNAPYEDQTWTIFGDSLADAYGGDNWRETTVDTGKGDTWTGYLFASRIGRELRLAIDNQAKSGSNIYGAEANSGVTLLDQMITDINAGKRKCPDYITVHFGTNSGKNNIGTIGDAPGKSTVYAATKYFVQQLRELTQKNPHLVYGFVLPPFGDWMGNGPGKDIDAAYKAMKEVLDSPEWYAPYVDMRRAGITVDMLPDGIHIKSERANNLYYHALRGFMMTL